MKIHHFIFCFFLVTISQRTAAQSAIRNPQSATSFVFVNPFIGTGGHGHTYPGATAPFGLVQLSPDTRIDMLDWDGCSGYHYSDSIIYGFSHTHLSGTGVADYCDILFMPYTGGAALEPAEYASSFKKSKEKAEAGYYSVVLEKDKILAELTATERVGMHRYTFPKNRERGHILIDLRHRDEVLDSYMKRVSDREIEGYRISKSWAKEQHVYFVARFSKPFFASKILDMSKNPRETDPSVTGKAIVGLYDFYNDNEPLIITVGISGTSIEGARKNLEAECAHFDFEKIKTETQAKWQRQLSKIEVEGGTDDQKTIFYTALYHTMLAPNIWNDVDGQYRGRDNKIHPNPGHDVYTVFSLWDTYRALHPLHTILEPKRTNDFIQTFLRQYEQGGLLPIWELAGNETDCMIGNHAIPVIADTYAKGIRGFDANLALEAMLKSANQDRYGMKWYRELGYVPADKEAESVSKTLEYAYDDWCISLLAQALGRDSIWEEFKSRSNYFMNIFDPQTKFFRAKSNATWQEPFDPYEVNFNYTEANAWQYCFPAPYAMSSMFKLYDGKFCERLDSLFFTKSKTTGRNQADITGLIGQYVHGNEPSHHIAYLYNNCYQPWETQRRVRQIMDEMYSNKPDGLSGNEDCGQMSAWFVFSAMGFYPLAPGVAEYTLGTPLFERVAIVSDNGKKFVIEAPGVSKTKFYVEKVSQNGIEFPRNELPHHWFAYGMKLNFEMSDKPTTRSTGGGFGYRWPIIPAPFVVKGKRVFRSQTTVELGCIMPETVIFYTLDGSEPTENSARYEMPILFKNNTVLKAAAFYKGKKSKTATAEFSKISGDWRVHLYNCNYSPQYTGGGNQALTDGIRGNVADFRTGGWQGFEGQNFNVEFDLGKSREINKLSAGFLQDENAWIFFPTKIQVEISDDGQNFSPAGEVICDISPKEKGVLQKDFVVDLKGKKGRYVRVIGVSLGKCPDWHKGAGYPCWVFADEVKVD